MPCGEIFNIPHCLLTLSIGYFSLLFAPGDNWQLRSNVAEGHALSVVNISAGLAFANHLQYEKINTIHPGIEHPCSL